MLNKILLTTVFLIFAVNFIQAQANRNLALKIEKEFKLPLSKIGDIDTYARSEGNILSANDISALKKIIVENGFPTNSMVGEKASHMFWSLVMQCNSDIHFQLKVAKLMFDANEKKDVNVSDFAMLIDRVLMNQEKPQLYGTQYVISEKSGQAKQYKTDQPEKLQERRKSLNLPGAIPEKTKTNQKVKGTAQRGDPKARY